MSPGLGTQVMILPPSTPEVLFLLSSANPYGRFLYRNLDIYRKRWHCRTWTWRYPQFIIVKNRSRAGIELDGLSLQLRPGYAVNLNTRDNPFVDNTCLEYTSPTSSAFSIGTSSHVDGYAGDEMIAFIVGQVFLVIPRLVLLPLTKTPVWSTLVSNLSSLCISIQTAVKLDHHRRNQKRNNPPTRFCIQIHPIQSKPWQLLKVSTSRSTTTGSRFPTKVDPISPVHLHRIAKLQPNTFLSDVCT